MRSDIASSGIDDGSNSYHDNLAMSMNPDLINKHAFVHIYTTLKEKSDPFNVKTVQLAGRAPKVFRPG